MTSSPDTRPQQTQRERLAVNGGVPSRRDFLPYGHQSIEPEDIDSVVACLEGEWLTTGPAVDAFERAFADAVDASHAVAVCNGTAALHAAVWAAGIQPGDEVIVPALTFAASANCVRYVGATVVFADVRSDTLTVDAKDVERRITSRTRAIVAVDYAGQPADHIQLSELATRHHLTLIDDAAHALGAKLASRAIGNIADLTTFSLHPVKHITTGEGGVITTNDPELAAKIRSFRNHGIATDHRLRAAARTWIYDVADLGYNYRLSDLQASLGSSQLRRLPKFLARRHEIATTYHDAFTSLPHVQPLAVLPDRTHAWHLYVVLLDLEGLDADRDTIFAALRAENIGVNVHYIPVPWHTYYRSLGYEPGEWPVAEAAYTRMLTLPLWPGMEDGDVRDVVSALTKVVAAFSR